MHADVILMWIGLFSAVVLLATAQGPLWTVKALLLLAVGALGAVFWPYAAGWAEGGAWAGLVAVPAMLGRIGDRMVAAQRYPSAVAAYAMGWVTHPSGERAGQVATLRALMEARRGRIDAAIARLERVSGGGRVRGSVARSALFHQRRLEGRLDRFVDEVDWAEEDPALAPMLRLRALASLGRVAALVEEEARAGWRLRALRVRSPFPWAFGLLWLLVGTGRVAALRRLVAGPLRALPSATRDFAVAMARLAAGEATDEARAVLAQLAAGSDRDLAAGASRALAAPSGPVVLTPAEARTVEAAEADLAAWLAARAARPRLARSAVTLVLVAANLAVFGAELALGGSENEEALTRLGALWPPYVLAYGQWWRVGAASFLHLGWLHLAMNMMALVVLGVAAERSLGAWRMLVVYAVAGLGAMAGIVLLTWSGWMDDELVVGASGAIMGLVGALLAQAARAWWRARTRATLLRLAWIAGVVALQSALDVATPEVSFAGHAMGVAIGFAVTLPLAFGRAADVPAANAAGLRNVPSEVGGMRPDRRRLVLAAVGGTLALATALKFPGWREQADAR